MTRWGRRQWAIAALVVAPLTMGADASCGGDPSPSCWDKPDVPMMGCSGPNPHESTTSARSGDQPHGHYKGDQPRGDGCEIGNTATDDRNGKAMKCEKAPGHIGGVWVDV